MARKASSNMTEDPESQPFKGRGTQQDLPGVEGISEVPEIQKAVRKLQDAKLDLLDKKKAVDDQRERLIDLMRERGMTDYRSKDFLVRVKSATSIHVREIRPNTDEKTLPKKTGVH